MLSDDRLKVKMCQWDIFYLFVGRMNTFRRGMKNLNTAKKRLLVAHTTAPEGR